MDKLKQVSALGIATFTEEQVRRAQKGEKIKMLVDFEMKKDKWHMSLIREADLRELKQKAEDHSKECKKLNENLEIFTRSLGQDKNYVRDAGAIHYRLNFWIDTNMIEKLPGEYTCLNRCTEHDHCILLTREWHFKPSGDDGRSQELLKMKPIMAISEKLAQQKNDPKNKGEQVEKQEKTALSMNIARKTVDESTMDCEKSKSPSKHFCEASNESSDLVKIKTRNLETAAGAQNLEEDQLDESAFDEIGTLGDAKNKIGELKWKLADCTKQLNIERINRELNMKTVQENFEEQLELLFHELEEANRKNLESASTEIRLQMKDLERNSDKGLIMVKNNVRDAIEEMNDLFHEIIEIKDQVNRKEIQEKVSLRKKLKDINNTLSLSLMSLQQLPGEQACNFHQFESSTDWFKEEESCERLDEANYTEKQ